MRLIHLAIAFLLLTVSVILILDIVIPPLIQKNPVLAFYFVVFIMIFYAVVSFGLARLSRRIS